MTVTDQKPEPIAGLGIIVDLSRRTVTFNGYVVPVTSATASVVEFAGQQTPPLLGVFGKSLTISGSIDRVTGAASINWWHENITNNSEWGLTCRPATRMF
jgi:hypothetical protein